MTTEEIKIEFSKVFRKPFEGYGTPFPLLDEEMADKVFEWFKPFLVKPDTITNAEISNSLKAKIGKVYGPAPSYIEICKIIDAHFPITINTKNNHESKTT